MRFLVTILFISTCFQLGAQIPVPYTAPRIYNLNSPNQNELYNYLSLRYDVSTNFISNDIGKICEDAYGRIWITGANIGFACIDGGRVYHYGSQNGFFDRQQRIHADKFGGIWVGGNGTGVYHLESPGVAALYTRTPLFFPDTVKYDISDVHISGLTSDQKGNIWIGTALNGITCIAKDSIYFIDPDSTLEDKGIKGIVADKNDIIWFIYNGGLYFIENMLVNKYELPFELERFSEISLSAKDFIVLSTASSIYKVYKDSLVTFNSSNKIPDNINQCAAAPNGDLYFRTGNEVYKLVQNNFILIFDGKGEFGITDFLIDSKNNLWITSRKKGLVCFPNFSINRYPDYKVLCNANNKLIVNNEHSVFELKLDEHQNEQKIKHFDLLPEEKIKSCTIEANGFLYHTDQRTIFVNEKTKELTVTKFPEKLKSNYYNVYKNYYSYQENGVALSSFSNAEDYIHFNYASTAKVYLFHVNTQGDYYYLDGYHDGNAHIIKYAQGKIDTLFSNIGGDTLKITGAIYSDDSLFYITTWGNYILKYAHDSIVMLDENMSSNILFGNFTDRANNYWTGGIEGGFTYFDAKTKKTAKYGPIEGFPGSRPNDFGASALNDDVIIAARSGIVWFKLINDIPVQTQEDFFEKYDIQIFGWKDGLYGQDFEAAQINDKGVIIIRGRDRVLQVIYPNYLEESAPSNLHFTSIKSENSDREFSTYYRWYPGIKYNPINSIELDYSENLLVEISSIYFDDHFNQTYAYRVDDKEWSEPSLSTLFRIAGLTGGKHTLSFIAYSSDGNASEPISIELIVTGPLYESAWFWLILFTLTLILFIIIFRWRTFYMRKKARQLEQTVKERTAEIEFQKIELETQHTEIKDSIQYAKRLQDAILPSNESIRQYIKNYFVFFKPKDVVSGDFYWFEHRHDATYFAVADCTGHGVPGALVSVVCSNALNRSIKEFNLASPNEILNKTRDLVIETFSSNNSNVKDGMDISICAISNKKVLFAGANNPLWIVRKKKYLTADQLEAKNTMLQDDLALIEYKGDKQPVGLFAGAKSFSQVELESYEGDRYYLFSDGYADQFGGENHSLKKPGGKKLKYTPFKNIILSNHAIALQEQGNILNSTFDAWKGSFEQVDDVCVVGFSLD